MKPKRIGITGGIGSGKSYVSNLFSKMYNIPLYNTDNIAKDIMINNKTVKQEIIETFGDDLYNGEQINKPLLRKLLFENNDNLKKMNSIIVPLIMDDFNNWCDTQQSEFVLFESAIIFETKIENNFYFIICVVADKDIRIDRVSKRDNISNDIVNSYIKNQLDDDIKIGKSDFVIKNNSTNNDITTIISDILKLYNKLKTKINE